MDDAYDEKNTETFDFSDGPTSTLPSFFQEANAELETEGLGGGLDDGKLDETTANDNNDQTFGQSLEELPMEGLPDFFAASDSQPKSKPVAQSGFTSNTFALDSDDEWRRQQELFSQRHEEFVRQYAASDHASAKNTEQAISSSFLDMNLDDDDALLSMAMNAAQEGNQSGDIPISATEIERQLLQSVHDANQTEEEEEELEPLEPETVVPPINLHSHAQMTLAGIHTHLIKALQYLSSPMSLKPGLEGASQTPEMYTQAVQHRFSVLRSVEQMYAHAESVLRTCIPQSHAHMPIPRFVVERYLNVVPLAALATEKAQTAIVEAYASGAWQLPNKFKGERMTERDVNSVAAMQGRQLSLAGAMSPQNDWYLHFWRAHKIERSANVLEKSLKFPEHILIPHAVLRPLETLLPNNSSTEQVSEGKLESNEAITKRWGDWTRSRIWESANQVLGRADKSGVYKPRRILNLGDEPEAPTREAMLKMRLQHEKELLSSKQGAKKSNKSRKQSKENTEKETKNRFTRTSRKFLKAAHAKDAQQKEREAREASKALRGFLSRNDESSQTLWSARIAISYAYDALLQLEEAILAQKLGVRSAEAPRTPQAAASENQRISALAAELVKMLGLERQFKFIMHHAAESESESTKQSSELPQTLTELISPSEDGLALLLTILSMSKGKQLLKRVVPSLPIAAAAAMVTAAMNLLPRFVASQAVGTDADNADKNLTESLSSWIRTTPLPPVFSSYGAQETNVSSSKMNANKQTLVVDKRYTPLSMTNIWLETLLRAQDEDVLAVLLSHAGGAMVISTLIERGVKESELMERHITNIENQKAALQSQNGQHAAPQSLEAFPSDEVIASWKKDLHKWGALADELASLVDE